jgi:hypothetical protein
MGREKPVWLSAWKEDTIQTLAYELRHYLERRE